MVRAPVLCSILSYFCDRCINRSEAEGGERGCGSDAELKLSLSIESHDRYEAISFSPMKS